jgi:hypothetical protein
LGISICRARKWATFRRLCLPKTLSGLGSRKNPLVIGSNGCRIQWCGAPERNKWQAGDIAPEAFDDQRYRVKSQTAIRDFTANAISEVNYLFR